MSSILGMARALFGRFRHVSPPAHPVDGRAYRSPVDAYWNAHTVNSVVLGSAWESRRYMEWRFKQYPLCREFMGLWGDHDGEVVLDYGCGPGDDLAGFLVHTKARRVVGADVSAKALELARARAALHKESEGRMELLQLSDAEPRIPLPDGSIDYVHSSGVLHHSSFPDRILQELARVLRARGRGCIMVYNRESLWYHLFTAYERMILRGDLAGLTTEEAFARNTDGPLCPIARCYSAGEWVAMCAAAGLAAEFVGGYLSLLELRMMKKLLDAARHDERLPAVHRDFLGELDYDQRGFPTYKGKHAGIGGVYRITRR